MAEGIQIFDGILGSGKTLGAVSEAILPRFLKGAVVITNIQLNWKNVKAWCLKFGYIPDRKQYIYLEGDMLKEPHEHCPKGEIGNDNLLVLDECAWLFPARNWKKTSDKFFLWCVMLRRQRCDVILICQNMAQIDKQFRDLFQFRWHFNNFGRALHIPLLGRFPWELLTRVQYDQNNQRLGWKFCKINYDAACCYNTLQEVVAFNAPEASKINSRRVSYHDKMVVIFHRVFVSVLLRFRYLVASYKSITKITNSRFTSYCERICSNCTKFIYQHERARRAILYSK